MIIHIVIHQAMTKDNKTDEKYPEDKGHIKIETNDNNEATTRG
jgi:hypothetical protein